MQAAPSGFDVFVDESPAALPAASAAPAATPTASPIQQAAAAAMPAVTPGKLYGAESDALTARAVFTCLQLPAEALEEQVDAILSAVTDDEGHARSLSDSLLVDTRLALVSTEILRIARSQDGVTR